MDDRERAKDYLIDRDGDDYNVDEVEILAKEFAVVRADQREKDAKIAKKELESQGANSACMVGEDIAKAIREGK